MPKSYQCSSKVVVYEGPSAWRFLGLSQETAAEIREQYGKQSRAWGSLPVTVTLGTTTWETSLFPDRKSGTYLLPLKAQVRRKEGIMDGAAVSFSIELNRNLTK